MVAPDIDVAFIVSAIVIGVVVVFVSAAVSAVVAVTAFQQRGLTAVAAAGSCSIGNVVAAVTEKTNFHSLTFVFLVLQKSQFQMVLVYNYLS